MTAATSCMQMRHTFCPSMTAGPYCSFIMCVCRYDSVGAPTKYLPPPNEASKFAHGCDLHQHRLFLSSTSAPESNRPQTRALIGSTP